LTKRFIHDAQTKNASTVKLLIEKGAKVPDYLRPMMRAYCRQHGLKFRHEVHGRRKRVPTDVARYAAYRARKASGEAHKKGSETDRVMEGRVYARITNVVKRGTGRIARAMDSATNISRSILFAKGPAVRAAHVRKRNIKACRALIEIDDIKKSPEYITDVKSYLMWRYSRLEAIGLPDCDIGFYAARSVSMIDKTFARLPNNVVVLNDLNGRIVSVWHALLAGVLGKWYWRKLRTEFFHNGEMHRQFVLQEKVRSALKAHRIYSFLQDRRGAYLLFGGMPRAEVFQAQAVARQARLHLKIADELGHRTTYLADRVLSDRRLSNLPTENDRALGESKFGYPQRYVVIDATSKDTLMKWGVPEQRIYMYDRGRTEEASGCAELSRRRSGQRLSVVIVLQTFQSAMSAFVELGQYLSGIEGIDVYLREHPNFRFSEEGRQWAENGAKGTLRFQDPKEPIDGGDVYITGFSTAVVGPAQRGAFVIWLARANPLALLLEEFFSEIALRADSEESCRSIIEGIQRGDRSIYEEMDKRRKRAVGLIGSENGVRSLRDLVHDEG
jgi:hypothetical protein